MAPTTGTCVSDGKPITIEFFLPASGGTHPLVLVLHGSFGLLPQYRPDIVSFADALNAQGIAAALPHYLEVTGTAPGPGVFSQIDARRNQWQDACSDALAALAGDERFDVARMGVLGFSLGGCLALGLAMDIPPSCSLCGAVDFFGPVRMLDGDWSSLPRLLIMHGDADPLVDPTESTWLAGELVKAGRSSPDDFELEIYPSEGHGFKGAALKDSRERTCAFFGDVFDDGKRPAHA
jgi:carboxymethylenebutenolidase